MPDDEPDNPASPSTPKISDISDISRSGNLYSVGHFENDETGRDGLANNDPIDTGDPNGPEAERPTGSALPNIENRFGNLMGLPSADQAADLRKKAPELYSAWLEIAKLKAETDAFVRRAEYKVPASLARTGRPWALGALVFVLALCGYIASLGGAGEYIAGILASIHLVAMLGLFMGFSPEAERRRARVRENRSQEQEKS